MTGRWIGAAILTMCAATAAAQTAAPKGAAKTAPAPAAATDKAAIEKALIASEQKVNDAVTKGDVAAFKSVVADDAWSIDESMGVASAADFVKMLKPGLAKVTDMKLSDFKVIWIDDHTAVLTYTWTGKGTFMDQPIKSPTFSSSLYTMRGGKWVNVFHQETIKAPAPPAAKK